jgi:RNA polymerase sigma factor (sigma-70 family)
MAPEKLNELLPGMSEHMNIFESGRPAKMDETQHWEQLKKGQMQGLQALYNLHVKALYAYGINLCRDPDKVKDCIHELFLAIWNNHASVTIPQSGKAYLLVSLRRRIFDPGPKSNLDTDNIEDTDLDYITSTPDHETNWILADEEQERQARLEQAMSRISERQREIIHMKYYQQMEYEDIARIMNLNYQSARNLVTRALMALRRNMILILLFLFIGI